MLLRGVVVTICEGCGHDVPDEALACPWCDDETKEWPR